jgi:hypothetical protein
MAPKRAHHCGILRFLQANDIRLASHSGGNANRSEPQAQNAHIEFLYLFDQQGTTVRPLQLFKSTIACVLAGKAQQRDMLLNKGLQLEKATTTPRSSKLLLLTARLATLVRVCNKLRAAMLRRHGKLAHLLKAKRGPSPRMLYDATRSSARLGSTTGGRANLTDLRCHHHQTNGAATATAIGRMKAAGSMELCPLVDSLFRCVPPCTPVCTWRTATLKIPLRFRPLLKMNWCKSCRSLRT